MEGIVGSTSDELEAILDDTRLITLVASLNLTVQEAAATLAPLASYSWFLQKKVVDSYLASLITNKEYISQLSFYTTGGTVFQSGGVLLLSRDLDQEWMQEALMDSESRLKYFPDAQRLFYTRPLYINKEAVGLLVAELDYSYIAQRLAAFSAVEKLSVEIFYGDRYLFGNNDGASVLSKWGGTLEERQLSKLRRENLVLVHPGSSEQIMTVGTISYNDLIGDALRLRSTVFLIILITLPLIFFTSWALSRRLSRNISSLGKTMREVGSGDLRVRSTVTSTDEIGQMAEVFNTMMGQIESLMEQVRTTEQQKRVSEFAALQSQIHPHFVYNTINSMKYYAHLKGVEEIEVVATAMVELLRAVLGQGDEFIPLSEEIYYIQQFLLIQQFKSQREVDVTWDIDEELLDHRIPKLLLQPIVENALIHGVANKADGSIFVKAYASDDTIHLKVSDNGRGIPKEKLRRLMDLDEQGAHQMSGVGISNVFNRIRMIYGPKYGGNISSYEHIGTVVELVLPA